LGSGDLFTAQDCLRMMQETGIDGVTIARGAIGNPWIFQQARDLAAGLPMPDAPRIHVQREVMERHWQLAEWLYGPQRTPTLMRKFGIKYSTNHPQHLEVRPGFARIRSHEEWKAVLDRWYTEDGPGVYPSIHTVQDQTEGCDIG
jgi:tRNA-dihydrouridine synthase